MPQERFICDQRCSSDELSGLLSKASGVLERDSAGKSSASPFPYCPEIVFGTRKIKAINRVFPMERGDIQTFYSSSACLALSLLLMP